MSANLGKPGTLYIVATPIGNLADITDRAREILSQVDAIAAEDTRHSGQLLSALGLSTRMFSLHEYNEASKSAEIIDKLLKGSKIALISDAGTPLISDPGFKLVDMAHQNHITIVPIPGPSSVMAALSVAGIGTSDYRFVGFLPSKSSQRQKALATLAQDPSTLVIFESPHRIRATVNDLVEIFGSQRLLTFCRELTKKFETVYRASLIEIKEFLESDDNQQRGEIVLVVSGNTVTTEQIGDCDYQSLLKGMLETMSLKDASTLLAKTTTRPRKYFYEMGLNLKKC